MPRRPLLALLGAAVLAVAASSASAQVAKPSLTHDDYDRWNRIDGEALSPDGAWVVWAVVPGRGDATLRLRRPGGPDGLAIPRATGAVFTPDSRWVAATVAPAHAVLDSLRRADVDGDDLPGDSVVVVDLAAAEADPDAGVRRLGAARSFRVAEGGAWLAVHRPADETESGEGGDEADEREPRDRGRPGTSLELHDLARGGSRVFEHVTDYRFTDDGRFLYLTRTTPDGPGDGVVRVETASGATVDAATGPGRYTGLTVQEGGVGAAFLTDRDAPDDDAGTMAVYVVGDDGVGRRVVAADTPGVPAGWHVSRHQDPVMTPSGSRVVFGLAPDRPPVDPAHEDLLDDERVRVDVWNWRDDRLQPMQLVELDDDTTRAYTGQAPIDGGPVVLLGDPEVPDVRLVDEGDGEVALGLTDRPYRRLVSWDGRYTDAYLIDVATGERRRVVERLRGTPRLSPGGRWVYWWDGERRGWFARAAAGGEEVALTAALPGPVHDLFDDRPEPPGAYGSPGWTTGDAAFLVYDRTDLWAVDPERPGTPRSVTDGVGARDGLRFRAIDTDPDTEAWAPDEPLLLSAFDLRTKASGLYRDRIDGTAPPRRLLFEEALVSSPRRADDADRFLFTRETFEQFPDLWVAGPDFDDAVRVSNANPQQAEVRWGSSELVEWTSNDGTPLQGILYTPEGFDPSRTWPMMVYFYERSSDGLHRHVVPSAGGSSINTSFYVSRGYLVFVPDIPYEVGHPGESALDAVVPGVQYLANQGFVDRERIGVQGHSWGGYQIAWMITRTNLFAAAEAGAPVANMTSAYGGIRWGTGMSRMFQYERTQSRIGGTLWEAPLLYLQNSPLFMLDKVTTPLLMMHNDEDTAVPWEQGIELFVALRRLDKPVWLLNYNGEPHGLRREANRKDWAIRMQQFFDHYLLDAPAPVWMEKGVPAVAKGRSLGLDLVGAPGR